MIELAVDASTIPARIEIRAGDRALVVSPDEAARLVELLRRALVATRHPGPCWCDSCAGASQ